MKVLKQLTDISERIDKLKESLLDLDLPFRIHRALDLDIYWIAQDLDDVIHYLENSEIPKIEENED